MKRLALIALLSLTGCGQSPMATNPTFTLPATIAPVTAPADGAEPHKAILRAAGPQSGQWTLTYELGAGNVRRDTVQLTFQADGHVALNNSAVSTPGAINHWDATSAEFEGNGRKDLLNRMPASRDRLKLTVDSSDTMHGTISLRANLRWIALPVTARLNTTPKKRAGFAIQPGTIVDTTASESFD